MKRYAPRILLGLAIVLVLLGHAAQIYKIGWLSRFDAILYDEKVRLTMPNTVDDRIVILDIDEKSLAEHGRWPWSRDKMAQVVDQLFDRYHIKVLGFDVVFAEPDISSGIRSLEQLAAGDLRNDQGFQKTLTALRPQLDYDARFAKAIKNRPVVLGYYLSGIDGGVSNGVLPAPTFPGFIFEGRRIAFTLWSSFGGNLPVLQEAASAAGHFVPMVDLDGISRRIPLLTLYDNNYYEALAVAVVRTVIGAKDIIPGFPTDAGDEYAGIEWIDMQGADGSLLRVPVDDNAATLIPFRGNRGSFKYISLGDVLTGSVAPQQLEGRIVLVGTTAPGLMDLRATPVDIAYPGVEAHASMIAGMLDGTIKHKPSYIVGADVLLIFASGVLLALLLPRLSPFVGTLVAGGTLAGLIAFNLTLWSESHVVMPLAASLSGVIMLYAFNMSWGYFIESRSKRQFTQLFGQYVPPELVDEMARNPEGYTMDGRRADLTVLFSDVRGFTTISEGLQPDQLAALMNEYLGAMTTIIRAQRGTLDKYIGDAIMAFWGAPVADPHHARNAVMTALEMQKGMRVLNEDLKRKGWPELKIGVGVNSGPMTVGDMGSPVRKAYTVMGDAVNLGSRLEGITKQYGVGILVGEDSWQKCCEDIEFRELDRVRVKGKAEPVGIYEPLGLRGEVPGGTMQRTCAVECRVGRLSRTAVECGRAGLGRVGGCRSALFV